VNILTTAKLENLDPGTIFASGSEIDNSDGLNMTGSGRLLYWVAVRGQGMPDWAIYCDFSSDLEFIKASGQKVGLKRNIVKLVPCTDSAFKMYRL